MTEPTETTETTGAEPPPPDYHVVSRGDVDLVVFVHADGKIVMQAHAAGMHVSLYVPAHAAAAFVRAVSTPYSGGTSR